MTKPIQNPQSNIQDINNYKVKIIIDVKRIAKLGSIKIRKSYIQNLKP